MQNKTTLLFIGLLITFFTTQAQWTQVGSNIIGEASDDLFGWSVSLNSDGTVMAVGAKHNSVSANKSGHVRIYKDNNGIWEQIGNDIDGETANDKSGTSVSLNSDGSVVAIGSPGNNSFTGYVRIYKNNAGTWEQIGSNIYGEATGNLFGYSVSVNSDGSIVAIGGPRNNGSAVRSGHVRVYKNNAGTWEQIGTDINGEAAEDLLGWAVSLNSDGTVIAIGATKNSENETNSGHVRVYKNNAGTWGQVGADIDGESAFDYFGYSVDISADGLTIAAGAYKNDGTAADAGHVRVYKNDAGTWSQVGTDIDGEAEDDRFGSTVSLSQDGLIVAIGAPNNDGGADDAGHVRVYQNNNGTWGQVNNDIDGETEYDNLGKSVSISSDGSKLVCGVPSNANGQVKVFTNASLSIVDFSHLEITMYPNPTNKIINIKTTNNLPYWFFIYDVTGKIVYKSQAKLTSDNLHKIDISNFENGVYIIKIQSDTITATNKFVKK